MVCCNCKKQLPDDSRFCQYCGTVLIDKSSSKTDFPEAKRNTLEDSVQNLVKRGFFLLEEGKWKKANDFFEKALEKDIGCAEAYLGKLMAERRSKTKEELTCDERAFTQNLNYQRALHFSTGTFHDEIERLDTEQRYQKAVALARLQKYTRAIGVLSTIGEYRNSAQLYQEYRALAIQQGKARRRLWILTCSFFVLVAILLIVVFWVLPERKYREATEKFQNKEYQAAFELVSQLKEYRNSVDLKEQSELALLVQANVGETIVYGSHNGQDIPWIVLEKQADRVLILSKDILLQEHFRSGDFERLVWKASDELLDIEAYDGTWKNSRLRIQMHKHISIIMSDFLYKHIITVDNKNSSGSNSTDKVFALAAAEVEKYLPDQAQRMASDAWWLRSAGKNEGVIQYVDKAGVICDDSNISAEYRNEDLEYGVRCAMWIDIRNVTKEK